MGNEIRYYPAKTQEDVDEILTKHRMWCHSVGREGKRADFGNLLLDEMDFSEQYLREVNFSNSSLRGANFRGSALHGADFSHSKLGQANFASANLTKANFCNAKLSSANFTNTNIHKANLILGGQDERGYQFYAYKDSHNSIIIRAGCRVFVNMRDARRHWEKHRWNDVLYVDIKSILDKIEAVAKARGWIDENEIEMPNLRETGD